MKLKLTNIWVDSSQKQSKEITKYVERAAISEYSALFVIHHECDIFVSKK